MVLDWHPRRIQQTHKIILCEQRVARYVAIAPTVNPNVSTIPQSRFHAFLIADSFSRGYGVTGVPKDAGLNPARSIRQVHGIWGLSRNAIMELCRVRGLLNEQNV